MHRTYLGTLQYLYGRGVYEISRSCTKGNIHYPLYHSRNTEHRLKTNETTETEAEDVGQTRPRIAQGEDKSFARRGGKFNEIPCLVGGQVWGESIKERG